VTELLAWVWAPAVLYVLLLGLGLLADAVLRTELPGSLLAPLGLALCIVVVTPIYKFGGTAAVAAPLAIVGALVGFLLARDGLATRVRPGPAALSAIVVYLLYLAPVALSGHATWAGYNFVNDTASNFIFSDLLEHHGARVPAVDSGGARISQFFVESGYPLGTSAVLATLRPLTGASVEAVYQPVLSGLAAVAAMSLAEIARRCRLRTVPSALSAVLAMGGVLLYRYTLHGGIKEIALAALLAAAAAIAAVALERRLEVRAVMLVALCGLAMVLAFSAVAGAYALALGLALLVAAFVAPRPPTLRHVARLVAVAFGLALVGVLPSLGGTLDFARAAKDVFAAQGGASTGYLGHLLRPLPVTEIAGVWVARDYRLPPEQMLALPNTVLVSAAVALAAAGLVVCVRRRLIPPLLLLAAALVPAGALAHFVSPYADGKLFVAAAPPVVLVAAVGSFAVLERARRAALRAAALTGVIVLAAGVLVSDFLAYRATRLDPTDRIAAMVDVGERIPGRGLWLLNEWEEFGKFFMRSARINPAFEAEAPKRAQLRTPDPIFGRWYDLDRERLAYVQSFPGIVVRRSPASSRPPASFRKIYSNAYYELWQRVTGLRVRAHLPLQRLDQAYEVPRCSDVRELAATAHPGERLVAAQRPRAPRASPFLGRLPKNWFANRDARGTVVPVGPGKLTRRIAVPGGKTRVWLRMSGARPIAVSIDGHGIGAVEQVNTPGQWLEVAVVDLERGDHRVELRRGGFRLAPGDSDRGYLGPLALEPVRPARLVSTSPSRYRRLCGRSWDWIELVGARK
jgi:hypothetical protein